MKRRTLVVAIDYVEGKVTEGGILPERIMADIREALVERERVGTVEDIRIEQVYTRIPKES